MLYTKSLLDPYLDTSIDPHALWDMLTLKVCEVEEVFERKIPDDVVIWLVTETRDHPDAEKLTVCQVDCGKQGSYQICCGATNVRAGIFVVVALPGCHLPAINLTIEPRELRGEASNGMICSKEELWIAEDLEEKWIRALQKSDKAVDKAKGEIETVWDMDDITDKDVWTPLGAKYPRLHSRSLDVENKTITHRPDMFGHFWLAVELWAMGEAEQGTPKLQEMIALWQQLEKIFERLADQTTHDIPIKVESDKVLTYATILIQDIDRTDANLATRLQMTELWLQSRSNWVDYSNLFMYRTGQPVHFFDADKIQWWLIIRQAKEGERFVDLFDKEHELTSDDIVIADTQKICALAWVVWSNTSGIDENTKNILVEIANFDPIQVRKSGTRLWLRTDAELRFEKTINPIRSLITTKIIYDELAAWHDMWWVISGISEWVNKQSNWDILKTIEVDRSSIATMMWHQDDAEHSNSQFLEGQQIVTSLGCIIQENMVHIPARRSPDDLETQACITEEIARIYWFDAIPSRSYSDQSEYIPYIPEVSIRRDLESLMVDRLRYDQIETYPWIHSRWMTMLDIQVNDLYQMSNGLNPEWKYLRPTMIGSLLEVVEKNAPFLDTIRIFDIGNVWSTTSEAKEEIYLWWAIYQKSAKTLDDDGLLESKSIVRDILATSGAKGKLQYIPTDAKVFHPLQQADIKLNGNIIWNIQTLHPYYAEQLKLSSDSQTVVWQLNLRMIVDIAQSQKKWSRGMSTYETLQDQIVTRDLNFVIDTTQWYGTVSDAVLKTKEVQDIEVFDLYAGDKLPTGKKSIAMRLKITADKELTSEDINAVMERAIESVKGVGGELR